MDRPPARSFFSASLMRSQKPAHAGGPLGRAPEHVGMAAQHLARYAIDHIAKRKCALLLGHACVVDHLQE